ncbi:hypothetical protein CHLRE_08g381702v5 [Chlamydomonas reinhardtii]|uniref:Succinate-semialdehyde dehydrogenase, mitochondrial n=1 Tax=Chlamydomonas reinhardtii TaxID=3055 RepID=A0A2K3DI27_CHLRE|nr:uncharacterized protein CHLRE_08g381702v5 [Chlamydomonas reinhardtii]PNW80188.1 hypothetical protein CHLRE_08g381702v5 [Chlamydomonas reinhardtii]
MLNSGALAPHLMSYCSAGIGASREQPPSAGCAGTASITAATATSAPSSSGRPAPAPTSASVPTSSSVPTSASFLPTSASVPTSASFLAGAAARGLVRATRQLALAATSAALPAPSPRGPLPQPLPQPLSGVRHKGTRTNLDEAAQATGLSKPAVSADLMSRVKDAGLVRTAGLIGGKWTEVASDKGTFDVLNPATGAVIATLPRMRADETRAAIAAAHSVLPQWRATPARERAAILRRWHDLILQHQSDIAALMTAECGKPTAEALAEIAGGAASVDWFAGEAVRVAGDVLEPPSRDRRMVVLKQPVGVVGAITPWNFPMSMITRKVAPALAAGCTVVLKPAELTPLTAIALAGLAERAGLPDGVLNLVLGDAAAIGHELVHSDTVRKIGFTGSTAVGKMLAAGAGAGVKRVSLELGGNAPVLVFEDADLELAARGIVASALRNAGQTCICANRVFVHTAVYDKLAEAVVGRVRKLKVGDGAEPGVHVGPLITPAALDKVTAHVHDAVAKGGKLLVGGGRPEAAQLAGGGGGGGGGAAAAAAGNFYLPTVIGEATIDMRCFKEETFGPLIPLFRFTSDEEAVLLANTTEYGLAAYFYTRDLGRAWRVAEELEFGMIGLNEVAITSEVAPFGGVKQSGLGREQSKYGIAEFMDIKYVCMGLGYARPSDPSSDSSTTSSSS